MVLVRIQKLLAQAGVASRRKAEEYITQGRVRVEGRVVTELGAKAEESDKIELDGKRLVRAPLCYGVLHKPRGMLTTLSDPEGRPYAGEILSRIGLRVVPVGRLDFNTSGVLLFTNDGDFAQALTHARSRATKVYLAKVRGELDDSQLGLWAEKIEIDGRMTEPANVRALRRENGHTWLEVTLMEGRNRQVRRLGEHAGSMVVRLSRVSHAGITVEGLRPGEFRLLTIDELKTLKASFAVPKRLRGAITNMAELPMSTAREPRRRPKVGRSGERAAPAWMNDQDGDDFESPPRARSFARGSTDGDSAPPKRPRGAEAPERKSRYGSPGPSKGAPRSTGRAEGRPGRAARALREARVAVNVGQPAASRVQLGADAVQLAASRVSVGVNGEDAAHQRVRVEARAAPREVSGPQFEVNEVAAAHPWVRVEARAAPRGPGAA
jgi:23S rRNA pseudouridine2605 synthase